MDMHLAPDAKDTLKRSPTFTGKFIDPWNPDPDLICIEDIAHHLANVNRFSGSSENPYSVAQHSVYVARLLPPALQLAGLLHDAPEYLTGDLPHHIKHGPVPILTGAWKRLDAPIARAVEKRFCLWEGELDNPEIKEADDRVFNYEWECLVKKRHSHPKIVPWSWRTARGEFLASFERYFDCYTG